jgi:serine/threonine-protein kinase
LLGDAIDQRADVFSCGVLLWEALAGRRLFETDSIDSIVTRLMGGKLQLPELPPELAWAMPLKAVAMSALAVDPAQRFADCAELSAAIEDVAGSHVATHDDIAVYFGARESGSQPPLTGLIVPPSHSSSLSALVSPAIRREEPVPPPLPAAASEQPPPSTARRLWTASALLCVLGALGVSALARYNTAHANLHGAPSAAALPTVARAVAAPAPPGALAPTVSSDPVASAAPAAPPTIEVTPSRDVPAQPATGSHSNKPRASGISSKPTAAPAPAATHARPAKPAPVRDKTADDYGI